MTVRRFDDNRLWRKSSKSGNQGGSCVYVANDGPQTTLRDSKQGPTGPTLNIDTSDWANFLAHVATPRV